MVQILSNNPMEPFHEAIKFIGKEWPIGCMSWARKNRPNQLKIISQIEDQIFKETNEFKIEQFVKSWRNTMILIITAYKRSL